ncbi:GNAT family N-acetyltransferase [Nocardioides sp. S-58]|uniref:GNAT family N-acetyltransferase n=1 Tax=Nocardioides renjunii TaxID=3095075 RepID=A0ABU5KEA8_9ACTN|nr:GNAT family N-acetyltransferase [Nocardioides sp. S-58]MDZ5662785.1 GNAT family N-acetyltransferase [Nocardioides sp. S-58]
MPPATPLLREMRPEDVPAVLAGQEPAAVAGLSDVFPQDLHPFPRQTIADRWLAEIEDAATSCFVIVRHDRVVGFAAVRGDEVVHFGVEVEQWGTGVAAAAQDELLEVMRAGGVQRPWLRVYAGNARGRRFWEKLGWRPTGETARGTLPPYAELLTYELAG